jgi:Cu-Zn family superoxide dismutase
MNFQRKIHRLAALVSAVIVTAIGAVTMRGALAQERQHAAPEITKAVCVLTPTQGNTAAGSVTFTKQADGVLVEAHVTGLAPGSKHGFHIHEFGDISAADGASLGGHFNPAGHPHAAPDTGARHAGDLGNIEADAKGEANYKRVDKTVDLNGEQCILGRGVVVHAAPDDFSQPTGNAGARVAVGVIGVAKP